MPLATASESITDGRGNVRVMSPLMRLTVDYQQPGLPANGWAPDQAGVKNELVTGDHLDHYLEDSAARSQMLRRSDAFLRQAVGDNP